MTGKQLNAIEKELSKRGYRKYTDCLVSSESWAWFKTIGKGDGGQGCQAAFRVWDFAKYGQTGADAYGLDFWASPLDTDSRIDIESNWEPLCDIDAFERMAADFDKFAREHLNNAKK